MALDSLQSAPLQSRVTEMRLAAKNRDMRCIVVGDCRTAGELDAPETAIKYVLPLLVRVRSTDEVIAALHER
jgi:hypothetical protein